MSEWMLVAAPLLVGAIVLMARFVGCELDHVALVSDDYSAVVLDTPGLVGFWRLNDVAGPTATDALGSNPGTYAGAVTLGVPSGVFADTDNTAAQFDGATAYVDIPFAPGLNPAMEFTVEAIVNPSRIGDGSATDYHAVAFSRSGAGATAFGYILYLHGDSFEARIADGTTVIPVSVPATATADGGPYYLAMSYDGATLTLYVNHVDTPGPPDQQASAAAGYAANVTSDLLLGASNFPGPGERFFFPGVITDVAVYNVALSSDTVRSHFSVLMTGTA